MTAHAPLPWAAQLHHAQKHGGRTYAYITADGLVPVAAVTLGAEGCSEDEGRANIALICKAVNSHAHLIETLEKLLFWNEGILAGRGNHHPHDHVTLIKTALETVKP